ncbi:MAG: hypothetical protein PHW74_14600 [Desulfobacca sp.]|nr:hypothetical protein [Desulfobacca sp.]
MKKPNRPSVVVSPRNPFALPVLRRGKILSDRRQDRAGARDWQRRWLAEYIDALQEESHEQC